MYYVGHNTNSKSSVPTTVPGVAGSGAYADEDAIGTVITFPLGVRGNGTLIINSAILLDLDAQSQPLDLYIFDTAPTTKTDNASAALSETEAANILHIISFAASDYKDLPMASGSASLGQRNQLGLEIPMKTATEFYGLLVSNGGTPTYTASDHVKLALNIIEYA